MEMLLEERETQSTEGDQGVFKNK